MMLRQHPRAPEPEAHHGFMLPRQRPASTLEWGFNVLCVIAALAFVIIVALAAEPR